MGRKSAAQTVRGAGVSGRTNYMHEECTPRDFPRGPVVKTLRSQCRGPRFNPWSGN